MRAGGVKGGWVVVSLVWPDWRSLAGGVDGWRRLVVGWFLLHLLLLLLLQPLRISVADTVELVGRSPLPGPGLTQPPSLTLTPTSSYALSDVDLLCVYI